MSDSDKHIGRRLARLRRRGGLTQHRLAEETGMSLNRLVFAETGRIVLEPDEVERILSFLKTRVKKLADAIDRQRDHRRRHGQ